MSNPNKVAWDTLTEADFIHSCDCIVCKSLRDDSCRACSGCATHHVLNKSLRAEVERLKDLNERAYHDLGERTVAVITLESRVAVLETVAEAAERWTKKPSSVVELAQVRAALDAASSEKKDG